MSRHLLCQGSMRWYKPLACAVSSTCPAEGQLPHWSLDTGVMNHVLEQCWHVSCDTHFLNILGDLTERCCAQLRGLLGQDMNTLMWPFFIATSLPETGRVLKQNLKRNTSSFCTLHFTLNFNHFNNKQLIELFYSLAFNLNNYI